MTSPSPAVIEARRLSAGYDGIPIVRDLDLEVHPGEIVALIGPNGAGKSTTLLTLAGELPPIAGSVRFAGRETRAPLHRRAREGLGFVTEDRSVFARLSAVDNLRVGRAQRAAVLELFPELAACMGRSANLLSGGEQQMLTVARALVRSPRLLMIDELSLGLAPLVVQRLMTALRDAADRGVGVLVVEQHVRQILAVADRVYVLQRGKVVLEGAARDILQRFDELEGTYLEGIGSGGP